YSWILARTLRGHKAEVNSSLTKLTELAELYRFHLGLIDGNGSLPLVAFYPVERSVLDVPLTIRKSENPFDQFDGYENALNGGVD
ncbi:ATP-binding protein, partial [Klebsiella pneumoniae]|nr:ATP-binding protein [Klebsiella pneumoniae]